jgi:hypothetical protein
MPDSTDMTAAAPVTQFTDAEIMRRDVGDAAGGMSATTSSLRGLMGTHVTSVAVSA